MKEIKRVKYQDKEFGNFDVRIIRKIAELPGGGKMQYTIQIRPDGQKRFLTSSNFYCETKADALNLLKNNIENVVVILVVASQAIGTINEIKKRN